MLFTMILTVIGLVVFETICSIDNAIINAEVLSTMSAKARRWFLLWGLFFAVFLVRGLLPWLIVWATIPGLGPVRAFTASFSSDPKVIASIEKSAPLLMMGGGIFLVLLFVNWLFMEPKRYTMRFEPFIHKKSIWFYALSSVILLLVVIYSMPINPMLAISAVIGYTVYFITNGFKQNAEHSERNLMNKNISDIGKIIYLEILDSTFSIDGVLGAFAFTLSIPLILLGNGVGAIVVRQITVGNIKRIKKYKYLKNGAMYSILVLGSVMMIEGFGIHVPEWVSPSSTICIIGYFFWRSVVEIKRQEQLGIKDDEI